MQKQFINFLAVYTDLTELQHQRALQHFTQVALNTEYSIDDLTWFKVYGASDEQLAAFEAALNSAE